MRQNKKAQQAARLPQYTNSPAFMERFLVAIHESNAEIERSPNKKGIKLVDGSEMSADGYEYFLSNKKSMEEEFLGDLTEKIGEEKALLFCEVISTDWYDGRSLRNGTRVRAMKRSIRNYLLKELGGPAKVSKVVQNTDAFDDVQPLLSEMEIAGILSVNQYAMHRHIEEWKARHPRKDELSTDDVFLRRGLSLEKQLRATKHYREWDFISSYSLAFSAPEQFSQMTQGNVPAIVNGNIDLFEQRTLFFSPFIPGMVLGQLEAGVIPARKPQKLCRQSNHGGILEYIVEPAEIQLP
jgi:hypothetical protein